MSLRVIGCGFGRTGTDSLRLALNHLGFGPAHHMSEVMANPEQRDAWRAVAAGAKPDFAKLLKGYAACVDWPSSYYWRELVAAYPEAKVILTWRTPESWFASFRETILHTMGPGSDPQSIGVALLHTHLFKGKSADPEVAMAVYRAHVEAVMAEVPPVRLLVHRIGDGWPSLCAHLGVAVPDIPYPQSNSTAEFQERLARMRAGPPR